MPIYFPFTILNYTNNIKTTGEFMFSNDLYDFIDNSEAENIREYCDALARYENSYDHLDDFSEIE